MNANHEAEFVLRQSKDHQIYFVLRAANHEVVLVSETYTCLGAAMGGIESVRTHVRGLGNFQHLDSESGEPYFVLRAANREIIGRSEMYSSTSARDAGIRACSRAAVGARVIDERYPAAAHDSRPTSTPVALPDDARETNMRASASAVVATQINITVRRTPCLTAGRKRRASGVYRGCLLLALKGKDRRLRPLAISSAWRFGKAAGDDDPGGLRAIIGLLQASLGE